ncbi:hypothetical protein D3C72_1667690 [compost metagenome]
MASAKPSRLAIKKAYTQGTKRRRGSHAQTAPYSGIAASITTKVAVNSHCRFFTPPAMPMVSRTGRSMK